MEKLIEKIVERIDKVRNLYAMDVKLYGLEEDVARVRSFNKALEIIEGETRNYNNGWIPCNEKLPKVGKDVLVFTEGYLQRVWQLLDHEDEYVWKDEFGGWNEFEEVVAWQPLPSPYESAE